MRAVIEEQATAGRREWFAVAVLTLPAMLLSMDISVLYLAVPHISADLRPSSAELLWMLDGYGFLLAGFLIPMGALADHVGCRRLLLAGSAAFGIASVAAAYATSPIMLIAARAVLGVAGATLGPSALAIIRDLFRVDRQRAVAIAVWSTGLSVGGVLGPLVGGILLEWFWWGSVFLISVPVMALLLLTARLVLPEHGSTQVGSPDARSVAMSLVTVLSVIYGLKRLMEAGPDWLSVAALLLGTGIGIRFVRRQRKVAEPLLDPRLLRLPAFALPLAVNVVGFFAILGIEYFIAQYLQLVLGLSPLKAGLWTLPMSGAFIAGAMLSPWIIARARPAPVMVGGLAIAAAGLLMFTLVGTRSGLPLAVSASVLFTSGLAPVLPLVTNLILKVVPPARAGAASGLAETSTEFGGAVGIAVLGMIGAAVYRFRLGDDPPQGVSPEVVEIARDSPGAALAVVSDLPIEPARALIERVHTGFLDGLHFAAGTAAALMLVMAVVVLSRRDSWKESAE